MVEMPKTGVTYKMAISRQRLERALSVVEANRSIFVDLLADIHLSRAKEGFANGTHLSSISRHLLSISQDMSNIATLVERLEWQRGLWVTGTIDQLRWFRYACADIDLFHVEYRSIFDYLAQLLGLLADSPGQSPSSFEKLKNWLEGPNADANTAKIGKELADLVCACDWFHDLREVRNLNVHQGGQTLVFLDKPKILFQVLAANKGRIRIPEVMDNENVANFELYAGVFVGYLLAYLEDVATVVYCRLGMSRAGRGISQYPGIEVVRNWLQQALRIC